MNKKRKIKERLLCRAFITVMLVSLFVGVSSVKASAAGNDHSHSGYTAITSNNVSLLSQPGNYYLAGNITISSKIEITSGQTVNLCLNGYTIKITGNDSLFYIDNGSTLNIYDCIGTGVLTGGKGYLNGSQKGGAIYVRSSTLNMYGGTIKGNQAVWGGAVFIDGSNSTCTFNMYGGTISGNTAQSGGGGVEVENDYSYFNIYAGSIINNTVTEANGSLHKGGGVHFAKGTVRIYGTYGDVIIKDNTVAGVVNNLYLRSGKTITIPGNANISSTSSIGVSSTDCENNNTNVTIASGYSSDKPKCFFLDGTNSSSHLLVYESNSLSIVKKTSHTHSYSSAWYSDDTQHWSECQCGEKANINNHTISEQCSFNDDSHWYECTTCKYKSQEALHKFVFNSMINEPTIEQSGTAEYKCETCNKTKTDSIKLNVNDENFTVEKVNILMYNGQSQSQTINVYYNGVLLTEGIHYTLSGNINTNAGSYALTITGAGAFEGEREVAYTIAKAPLNVTAENKEITYGDAIPDYTVIYNGFVNDENETALGGALALVCDYVQYSNVGIYDINVSGYESDNYEITYVNGNVKVNQKVIGLDWSNLLFVYDGNAKLPTVTATGLVNGDVCIVTIIGEKSDAGVHIATAKDLSNTNYKLPSNATVEFVIQKTSTPNEVTSDDKAVIEEALEIIENLLSEENVGNLTPEEKATLEEQKAELTEKLENIKAAEEKMGTVEETVTNLPEANEVTSDDKDAIEETLNIIDNLLSEENVGNLTPEEKAILEERQAELTEKLENIKAAEEKMGAVEETVTNLPEANEVTSDDKDAIEETLNIIDNLLSEENVGNLTVEEKTKIEEQKAELTEKLENIKATEQRLGMVENAVNNIPETNEVTSDNKSEIERALGFITYLLSEENVGKLTAEEKAKIEEQKADIEEKLGNIKAAEEKMEKVEDTVTTLPNADEVTSEDKTAIENALDVIEDLLSDENVGNLTEEEKTAVEEQKADLEEKLGNIEAAEEKMETVEDTVTTLPNADEVTSENKKAIEDALEVIEDLLSEGNAGNLTPDEKTAIEEQKADLEEKLVNIKDAEEKMETVEETVTTLPNTNEVTGEDKTAIEDALEIIENLLSEEKVGNLTPEEKVAIEEQKADLEEKLDIIQLVEAALDVLQSEKGNVPSKDVITTESKDEVVELLDIIKDLQEKNPSNLTEEQSVVIEKLREELQEKLDKIQTIEDSLNKIENESTIQPDYDDITSDNKEDIKDIIKDIENILKDENENLSQQEKDALKEQKNELENKVAFIEQIEKYEPVSGDFKNTTEPEINDLNADLANDSNELIGIIPLEKTEKEHVAKSEDVKVYLEVSNITKTITEEAKELIETEVKDKKIAVYLDINLFKQIGEREPKKVPNTKGLVTITFKVPSNLVNTDNSVTRKYQVVRVHEGEVTIIDVVYDETTGMISFETDKFSTYAIVYKDVPVNDNDDNSTPGDTDVIKPDSNQKDEVPKTGGSNLAMYSCVLMFISGLGIVLISRKRKTYCKEN